MADGGMDDATVRQIEFLGWTWRCCWLATGYETEAIARASLAAHRERCHAAVDRDEAR